MDSSRALGIAAVFCAMLIALSSCNVKVAPSRAALKGELLAADSAFAKQARDENAGAAYEAFIADDAVQLPAAGEPVTGKSIIVKGMHAFAERQVLRWTPRDGDVSADGTMGWTWGTYAVSPIGASPACVLVRGKYLNVWRHTDKGWKLAVDMGNAQPE